MSQPWRRHDLILIEAGAWKRVLQNRPQLAALPHLAEWAGRGWPLIVRRRDVDDSPALVPAAISLPPASALPPLPVLRERVGVRVISNVQGLSYPERIRFGVSVTSYAPNHPHPCPLPEYRERGEARAATVVHPPACGKVRIALQVDPSDVLAKLPPQNLRAMCEQTPIPWRTTVAEVLKLARETGVEPCVFGGLLWQSLTGLPYLSANSDLDLYWPVTHSEQAAGIVRALSGLDENSPPRIDGEIILPDGGGVNWRELGNGGAEVIVKTMSCVRLCPIADAFGHKLVWN
jgi:phosphoribosyl-dephospho-CoA transferase